MAHQTFNSETECFYQDVWEAIRINHTVPIMDAWLVLTKINKEIQAQLDTGMAIEAMKLSGSIPDTSKEQP